MRGQVDRQQSMFVAFDLEQRVPDDHPLRPIKQWCDRALAGMSRDFNEAYTKRGRASIPPETLIKALLLRALYSIPSERRLCEAIEFNLLYRWFIDWPLDRPAFTPEVFSMNRERFELHELVRKFFERVVAEAMAQGLLEGDHLTVDGTLIRSMAGQKSIKLIGDDGDDDLNKWSGFKGGKRSNQTHRSVVDPEARLMRKGGGGAHLSHSMHVMTDSASGLCVSLTVDAADGRAERRQALAMLDRLRRRHGVVPSTLAADAGYGTGEFLCEVESRGIRPHAAMQSNRIVGDTEQHEARRRMRRRQRTKGYRVSQRLRRMVEPVIGWCKDTGKLARTRFLGRSRIQDDARVVGVAWNLLRMTRLIGAT
jgi:transposase